MVSTHPRLNFSCVEDEPDAVSVADAVWLASFIIERSKPEEVDEPGTLEKVEHFAVSLSVDEGPEQGEAYPLQLPVEETPSSHQVPIRAPTPLSETEKRTQQTGSQARVGGLRTLTDPQGFCAAIRSFRTKPRTATNVIDEAATVDGYAAHSQALLLPVMQRGARRWLRLSLVEEATATNALWSQSIDELESMAREQGAFRQVRRWALSDDQGACLRQVGSHGTIGRTGTQLAKIPFWKDEIVVLISDFTSDHWWNGTFAKAFLLVAKSQPAALLQTLPERLWNRSWAGRPGALAYAPAPACATSALQRCDNDRPASRHELMVPLIGMTSASFGNWSRAMMNSGTLRMPCIALKAHGWEEIDAPVEDTERANPVAPETLLMTYNMASSTLARRLAAYLAFTAPLTFPIMRWVQKATLPESDSSHLAEFVLGGLLQQVAGDASTSADDVVYDFVSGTKEVLQSEIPINHAIEVLRTVGAFLEANQSGTLDSRTGITTWPDKDLDELSPELRAFALVSHDFLARIGLSPSRARVPLTVPTERESATQIEASFRQSSSTRAEYGSVSQIKLPYSQSDHTRAEYSRRLRSRIIDMQWSPTEEGLLAILHEEGVELWDVLHEAKGVMIGTAEVPVISSVTIFWFAPSLIFPPRQMSAIKAILKLLSEGLESAGVRVQKIIRLDTLSKRGEKWPSSLENPLLVVVEGEHVFGLDGQYGSTLNEFNLSESRGPWLAVGAIRLSDRAPVLAGVDARLELVSFSAAKASDHSPRRKIAGKMGQFVRELSRQVQNADVIGLSIRTGASAICWLETGMLVVADRRGQTTVINEIDASDVLRRRSQSFTSQRVIFSGSVAVQRMICLPLSSTNRYSSRLENSGGVPLAWIDDDGALWTYGQKRSLGNGFPRMLAGAGKIHVAISDHGLGVTLISTTSKRQLSRKVELKPRELNNYDTHSSLESFFAERIIAVQVSENRVMALTSLGMLHRGKMPENENSKVLSDESAFLDPNPLNLQGTVGAASFTGGGHVLCVSKTNGTLELWDTAIGTRLDQLDLSPGGNRLLLPSLAISPDKQLVASANGKALKIFRVIDSHLGGIFATRSESVMAHILWVSTHPEKNIRERTQFKIAGINITLAQTTEGALSLLRRYNFAAVVSDIDRATNEGEDYDLLAKMRGRDDSTPVFIYTSPKPKLYPVEETRHSPQGFTHDAQELFEMVRRVAVPRTSVHIPSERT